MNAETVSPTAAPPGKLDRKFNLPGDVVNKATAELPDDQRSLIRWIHAYAMDHDMPLAELAGKLRYDQSTLWRLLNGKYEGSIENICREIESFRRLTEERAKGRKLEFIETNLSRRIERLCDAALEYQRIAFIFGDSQTGKTTALRHYTATHNHGSTVLVSMPTGGHFSQFLQELAGACRINAQLSERDLRRRLIGAFDDRMLIIVDEAHQCLGSISTIKGARSIEFVRELHDRSGCGVVLCGTNVFRDEVEAGRAAGLLLQCRRRRLVALQLPAQPTRADLDTFAAAYGLDPARDEAADLQTAVIRDEALGMWLCLLRMAAKLAHKSGKPITWAHVIRAHQGLRSLESLEVK